MKKLFFLVPVLWLIFLSGCGITSPIAPVVETGTIVTTVVDCQSDITCIQPLFLTCTPATFTPPFSASSTINVEIIWKTDDICDYKMTRSIQGMLVHKECKMPMTVINADRALYLFWWDKDPANLAIVQAQWQLDAQYCVEI